MPKSPFKVYPYSTPAAAYFAFREDSGWAEDVEPRTILREAYTAFSGHYDPFGHDPERLLWLAGLHRYEKEHERHVAYADLVMELTKQGRQVVGELGNQLFVGGGCTVSKPKTETAVVSLFDRIARTPAKTCGECIPQKAWLQLWREKQEFGLAQWAEGLIDLAGETAIEIAEEMGRPVWFQQAAEYLAIVTALSDKGHFVQEETRMIGWYALL